jgi:o-succinylbenzoate---CoA ligase
MSMLDSWISSHDSLRVAVDSPAGSLTYGDLLRAMDSPLPEDPQVIATPGTDPVDLLDLYRLPGRRQLVLIDPGLPAAERRRRVAAAGAARNRGAATIVFTSGTTGPARAVRLTAANWQAAVEGSAAHLRHGPDDVWLAVMPFHHVGGLSILYRSAYVGGRIRWLPGADAVAIAHELRSGVTMASLVPTVLRRILDADSGTFSGLRAVLLGGGPIPPGLLEEAQARGMPVLPTYGMTETCAQVATLRPGSMPRRAAHPLPGIELRIAEDGRIQVRGAQVSPGYADEGDRVPGSWFTTPDLGSLEPDGALQVRGRADDVIITGGENVWPGEVEGALEAHSGVRLAVVVGQPDPEWGERVVAAYEGEPLEGSALREWLRARLAPHQLPIHIRHLERIPLQPTGKPDRDEVRRLLG